MNDVTSDRWLSVDEIASYLGAAIPAEGPYWAGSLGIRVLAVLAFRGFSTAPPLASNAEGLCFWIG